MRDETNPEIRQHMLEYMISLMDDANDFSWISAKASHAVLLCRMEQGEIKSYSDTLAIDRIRRANAQKHITVSQTNSPQNSSNGKNMARQLNPCLAHILIKVYVYKRNPMRPGVFFTSTFVLHVLHQQAKPFLMQKLIVRINIKLIRKTIEYG